MRISQSHARIRQLQAYQAVMQAGSVTRAAEALGISQPAVSKLIQDLEVSTGLSLFERIRRRLYPTAEGRRFYTEVEQLFLRINRVDQLANEIRASGVGELRIAALPALGMHLIPTLLGGMHHARPDLRISLAVLPSSKVVESIASGEADIGFAFPVPGTPPIVVRRELAALSAVVVLPENHPLAARSELTPEDLDGVPMVSLGREDLSRDKIDALAQEYGFALNIGAETQFAMVVCELVCAGLGLALVDPVTAYFFRDRLERRLLRSNVVFEFGALTRLGSPDSGIVGDLVRAVERAIRTMPK